jgi:biopolymer transport protein ExbB
MQRNVFDGSLKAAASIAAGAMLTPGVALAASDTALLPRNLSPWNMFAKFAARR